MSKRGVAAFVALGLVSLFSAVPTLLVEATTNTKRLRDAVTVDGIRKHLEAFQAIANDNGGTRASGTPGYDSSAGYVASLMTSAGYAVTRQTFTIPYFQETAAPVFELTLDPRVYTNDEFRTLRYSGSGDVTAPIQAVDVQIPPGATPNSSTSGCEPEDFAGFAAGNIALLQRGTCPFAIKAQNAQAAGASAVIIFNEGQPGRTALNTGTLGGPEFSISVIGTSFAIGEELYNLSLNNPVIVRVATSTLSENRTTENIIAETTNYRTAGSDAQVVVVGAHLDSVPEGPGINDNGSGSATILEIALKMAELRINTQKTVRFIWFGAEEYGLLGSQYYVSQLSEAERTNISTMLNFDMVGSPNFVRFVYDGDGSETGAAGPEGSDAIENVFVDYFNSVGLETDATAFDGRSDYGPFIAVGIPAGGLFSGAEGIKTEEQAAIYGGTAGVAYDACYHQTCDNLTGGADEDGDNIDETSLDQLSDAAAHAVLTFATPSSRRGKNPGVNSYREHKGPDMMR